MRRFVAHDGPYWWWVAIHDTTADLIAAADRLGRRRGGHDPQPDGTLACFQPADNCGEPEENLAYIIGRTAATMTNALHERGIWS